MPVYQALLTSKSDSNEVTTVEVESISKSVAYELVRQQNFNWDRWEFTQLIRKPLKRGGVREGAGRPSKHGQKTVIKRVPESLAPEIDMLVTALPELRDLLADLEADCENNNSPRYHFLRQALQEIRSIGF